MYNIIFIYINEFLYIVNILLWYTVSPKKNMDSDMLPYAYNPLRIWDLKKQLGSSLYHPQLGSAHQSLEI